MKILLVEDEPGVISLIKKTLEEEGYEVVIAMDGPSALDLLSSFSYDLVILDVMLPGMSGLELCKICRNNKMTAPILMLTALGSTDNVVMGLDSGADDYLTKPFKLVELSARIRSLLRRAAAENKSESNQKNKLVFEDLVLDLNEKTVTRMNIPVSLTATEFRLLEYFMLNPRKVLSRMDILEKVWGYDFNMNTKVVDVYINYLRKKLDFNQQSRLINTVTGMGYILKAA